MNDILKALQAIDAAEAKTILTESTTECGGDITSVPVQNTGNPVTLSVNFNASGADHVTELLSLLKNAGVEPATVAPVDTSMIPGDGIDSLTKAMASKHSTDKDNESYKNEPDEMYQDHNYMTKDLSGGINGEKRMYRPAAGGDNPIAIDESGFDPDVVRALQSIRDIGELKSSAIDIIKHTQMNQKKKMSLMRNIQNSRTADNVHHALWNAILGKDNLHAIGSTWNKRHESTDMTAESIKDRLMRALDEAKSKLDFFDIDKDGGLTEPMKTAIKNKNKKR